MTLQMNEPLAGHRAELGVFATAQSVIAGFDAIDGVKARLVAQVNGGSIVPVQAIRCHPLAQLVLEHATSL